MNNDHLNNEKRRERSYLPVPKTMARIMIMIKAMKEGNQQLKKWGNGIQRRKNEITGHSDSEASSI